MLSFKMLQNLENLTMHGHRASVMDVSLLPVLLDNCQMFCQSFKFCVDGICVNHRMYFCHVYG